MVQVYVVGIFAPNPIYNRVNQSATEKRRPDPTSPCVSAGLPDEARPDWISQLIVKNDHFILFAWRASISVLFSLLHALHVCSYIAASFDAAAIKVLQA